MKSLVLYYSRTGNNAFLAKKTASLLQADSEEIIPYCKGTFFQILFSLIQINPGIHKLNYNPTDYDQVFLVGPIWMGQLIAPLKACINKYSESMLNLLFMTCCGGGDDTKDDKFGYSAVFNKVEKLSKAKSVRCQAFPILLVVDEGKRGDDKAIMDTRLNDATYKGEIMERLQEFLGV